MIPKSIGIVTLMMCSVLVFAQQGVGIGTSSPNGHAVLDVFTAGDNKGLMIPKVPDTNLFTGLGVADEGLLVYNEAVHTFQFFNGSAWENIGTPAGTVVMWSGSVIPAGWALCDGQNGYPDLRDRFVVGSGASYSLGATGGASTVALTVPQMPAHTHTASSDLQGSHTHTHEDDFSYVDTGWNSQYPGSYLQAVGSFSGQGTSEGPSNRFAGRNKTTGAVGNHNHNITVDANGSSQAHENRPPYYALAFIIKK